MVQSGSDADIDGEVERFRSGVPERTFKDVGGYEKVKEHLENKGIKPVKWRSFIQDELGQNVLDGVVLHGPSGTGKTLMARAFAGEYHNTIDDEVTVYKVKPNQLRRGIRGESSDLMRALFRAAKKEQPSVVIFEEIDSLIRDRKDGSVQRMESDIALVNSFLDEINEIRSEDVTVIGTTNFADSLDRAAVSEHRLEMVEMGLPDVFARMRIFEIHLESVPEKYVDWDNIKVDELASKAEGFTGAMIESVVEEAVLKMALEYKEGNRSQPVVRSEDLENQIESMS
jgi:transitional endoplasmic reticulum ATPase